jgi:hypothetical protein
VYQTEYLTGNGIGTLGKLKVENRKLKGRYAERGVVKNYQQFQTISFMGSYLAELER